MLVVILLGDIDVNFIVILGDNIYKGFIVDGNIFMWYRIICLS